MNTLSRLLGFSLLFVAAFGLLTACGAKPAPETADTTDEHAGDDDHAGHDDHASGAHGGTVAASSDHQAHFETLHDEDASTMTLYVSDANIEELAISDAPVLNLIGKDGSVRVVGVPVGGKKGPSSGWVFKHALLAGEPEGRFRVKIGGSTYTPECAHAHGDHDGHDDHDDHDGHDHDGDDHDGHDDHEGHDHDGEGHDGHDHDGEEHDEDAHGPHDGMLADLLPAGRIELKLHDDKGDLELWLHSDEAGSTALDLPLATSITVSFTKPQAKTLKLAVRNQKQNEGEDGKGNVRSGRTNYFIFPGDTGADASWLMGASFEGLVTVSFSDGGKTWTTEAFRLVPHTHADHGHGDHDDDDHGEHDHDDHEGHDHDK